MHNFTSNDLLLYLFNEHPQENPAEIEKAIQNDSELRTTYLSMQETIRDIENFEITPNDRIIGNIMAKFHHQKDVHIV